MFFLLPFSALCVFLLLVAFGWKTYLMSNFVEYVASHTGSCLPTRSGWLQHCSTTVCGLLVCGKMPNVLSTVYSACKPSNMRSRDPTLSAACCAAQWSRWLEIFEDHLKNSRAFCKHYIQFLSVSVPVSSFLYCELFIAKIARSWLESCQTNNNNEEKMYDIWLWAKTKKKRIVWLGT